MPKKPTKKLPKECKAFEMEYRQVEPLPKPKFKIGEIVIITEYNKSDGSKSYTQRKIENAYIYGSKFNAQLRSLLDCPDKIRIIIWRRQEYHKDKDFQANTWKTKKEALTALKKIKDILKNK